MLRFYSSFLNSLCIFLSQVSFLSKEELCTWSIVGWWPPAAVPEFQHRPRSSWLVPASDWTQQKAQGLRFPAYCIPLQEIWVLKFLLAAQLYKVSSLLEIFFLLSFTWEHTYTEICLLLFLPLNLYRYSFKKISTSSPSLLICFLFNPRDLNYHTDIPHSFIFMVIQI